MADYKYNVFADRTTNAWISRSTNEWNTLASYILRSGFTKQVYGLILQGDVKQLWLITDDVTPAYVIQLYGILLSAYVVEQYGDAVSPQNAVLQFYQDAGVPQNHTKQKYEDALKALSYVLQKWNILSSPLNSVKQLYAIPDSVLQNFIMQKYDLKSVDEVQRAVKQIWDLLNEDSVITADDLTTSVTTTTRTDTPVSTGNGVTGSGNINFTNPNQIVSDGGPDLSGFTDGMTIQVTDAGGNTGTYTVSGNSTSTTITIVESVLTAATGTSAVINEVVFTSYASAPTPFSPYEINISGSLSSYVMSCDLDLSREDFYRFSDLDDINLVVNSEAFNFIVIQMKRTFAHGKATYKVHGKSKAALLGLPYSRPLNEDYAPGFASDIAQSIASAQGITLVWEIEDWYVSANKLYANDDAPIDVIRTLVETPKGILQSDPDGTLRAVYRYKDRLDNPVDPITVFLETGNNFFSVSETYQEKPGYNKVYVGTSLSSDEGIELYELDEYDGQPSNTKYLAGYVVPWTGSTATLSTSSDDVDSMEYMGIVTEIVEEEITFEESESSLSRPVYAVTNVVWNDDIYGSGDGDVSVFEFLESGEISITVDSDAYTIATITYVTKYYKWRIVKNLEDDSTQFMMSVEI